MSVLELKSSQDAIIFLGAQLNAFLERQMNILLDKETKYIFHCFLFFKSLL